MTQAETMRVTYSASALKTASKLTDQDLLIKNFCLPFSEKREKPFKFFKNMVEILGHIVLKEFCAIWKIIMMRLDFRAIRAKDG